MANDAPKPSAVEGLKEQSRQLRGDIAEVLDSDADHFDHDGYQLLKFHGTYQQDDRDLRKQRSKDGLGKYFMFMVRTKQPGGKMTADQYLALDDIAGKYANGTIRLTTRQGVQFHGVLKENLHATIKAINDCLLTTLGACGDVNRNVMACPAPTGDPARVQMQKLADEIAEHLAPKSPAYHEIWLNGEQVEQGEVEEPIYGKLYLPRKFKIGFALPDDNCVDVYSQDLGFLAITEVGSPVGYDVLVGGGMGRTSGKKETFAHLGRPMCYVTPDQVVDAAEAVVKLFRDHGNRSDRKRARIKYLVHDWGTEKFREVLREYLPFELVPPRGAEVTDVDPHHGWHPQADGRWFFGVSVENGRIKDDGDMRMRSGLRAIAEKYRTDMWAMAQQDLLICNVAESDKAGVEELIDAHGIPRPGRLSMARRWSMACPAIPTCGLAISESERILPDMITELEVELEALGLADERISVRMTGCPNGCARPYQSDIGIVGRSGDKYTLYVGGGPLGKDLNFVLQDLVTRAEILPKVKAVLERFKADRRNGELFGDYCRRMGERAVREMVGVPEPKV